MKCKAEKFLFGICVTAALIYREGKAVATPLQVAGAANTYPTRAIRMSSSTPLTNPLSSATPLIAPAARCVVV